MSRPVKRGPGRPKGTAYGAVMAPLAVSAAEKVAIAQAAAKAGLSGSEWLRRAAAYCVAARVPLSHLSGGEVRSV